MEKQCGLVYRTLALLLTIASQMDLITNMDSYRDPRVCTSSATGTNNGRPSSSVQLQHRTESLGKEKEVWVGAIDKRAKKIKEEN
jgi:hypothetical protein